MVKATGCLRMTSTGQRVNSTGRMVRRLTAPCGTRILTTMNQSVLAPEERPASGFSLHVLNYTTSHARSTIGISYASYQRHSPPVSGNEMPLPILYNPNSTHFSLYPFILWSGVVEFQLAHSLYFFFSILEGFINFADYLNVCTYKTSLNIK